MTEKRIHRGGNKKGVKLKRLEHKPPIINNYDKIEDKKIILPEIINYDYGWEMQFGFPHERESAHVQYVKTKYIPEYRK